MVASVTCDNRGCEPVRFWFCRCEPTVVFSSNAMTKSVDRPLHVYASLCSVYTLFSREWVRYVHVHVFSSVSYFSQFVDTFMFGFLVFGTAAMYQTKLYSVDRWCQHTLPALCSRLWRHNTHCIRAYQKCLKYPEPHKPVTSVISCVFRNKAT